VFRALMGFSLCVAAGASLYAQGVITTVAGSDPTYPGNSLSAFSATFGFLSGVALSPTGDVYFASQSRSLIVRFSPQRNSLTIIAGTGIGAYSGDGGAAVNASLNSPQQIAFDPSGRSLYRRLKQWLHPKDRFARRDYDVCGRAQRPNGRGCCTGWFRLCFRRQPYRSFLQYWIRYGDCGNSARRFFGRRRASVPSATLYPPGFGV
jgi:hypothetical protein